jgi:DnaJ-class molecular chaperone
MDKKKSDYQRGQEDMRKRAADLAYSMDDEVNCGACNGSGYYDHHCRPRCGACKGEGTVSAKPDDVGHMITNLEIKE